MSVTTLRKYNQLVSFVLVIVLLTNLIFMPEVVEAQVQAAVPPQARAVIARGEQFMDAVPQTMGNALELAQLMAYINTADPQTLSEATVAQARARAWVTAQQAAVSQGAIGAIAGGIDDLATQFHVAADMDALMAELDTSGFSPQMETALIDAGLTVSQVVALQEGAVTSLQTRRAVSQTGFLTGTVTRLQDAGLTQTQIDQVAAEFATFGVADSHDDRLAQFRAIREEMSLVRDEALIVYVQLLSRQVFLQEQAGETGRAMTEADIDTLVQDELRLLTHLGYLDSLMGSPPDPEKGEGQWLFVERYSQQAVDHLETVILETHNVGLVVDLFVLLQLHMAAVAAQSGDPVYAKSDVDYLGTALGSLAGDALPGGQALLQSAPSLNYQLTLLFHEWTGYAFLGDDEVPAPSVAETAVVTAKEKVNGRLARLSALPLAAGSVQELDETNNVAWAHFYSAPPPDLPSGLLGILEGVIPHLEQVLDFVWGVLTGQSDNPIAIGINMVLSFVPVLGELLDLIALFTDPTVWGKVMALIGLVASLISDGAELFSALGIAFPPALAAVPAAIFSEVVDVAAAILKPIRNFLSAPVARVLDDIPFNRLLQIGTDAVTRLARNADEAVGHAGDIIGAIRNLARSVMDPLGALVRRMGSDGLRRLGFGDGGYFLGRILNLSDEAASYSDETLEAIARYGDELADAGSELSDEAAEGLGRLMDELGETDARRFLEAFPCPVATTLPKSTFGRSTAKLALNNKQNPLECALNFLGRSGSQLTDDQITGLGKFVKGLKDPEDAGGLLINFTSNTQDRLFDLLAQSNRTWSDDSIRGLASMTGRVNISDIEALAGKYSDVVFEQTFKVIKEATGPWTQEGMEGVAKIVKRFELKGTGRGAEAAERILAKQGRGEFGSTVFGWLNKVDDAPGTKIQRYEEWVEQLGGGGTTYVGTVFELKYAATQVPPGRKISVINDYPDSDAGVDFILDDGRFIEAKNWNDYGKGKIDGAVEQLRRNLGIDEAGEVTGNARYPNGGVYNYMFRKGGKNNTVVDSLCGVAKQALDAGVLTAVQYAAFEITFLDMPPILDKPGNVKGQPAAAPGPNRTTVKCP